MTGCTRNSCRQIRPGRAAITQTSTFRLAGVWTDEFLVAALQDARGQRLSKFGVNGLPRYTPGMQEIPIPRNSVHTCARWPHLSGKLGPCTGGTLAKVAADMASSGQNWAKWPNDDQVWRRSPKLSDMGRKTVEIATTSSSADFGRKERPAEIDPKSGRARIGVDHHQVTVARPPQLDRIRAQVWMGVFPHDGGSIRKVSDGPSLRRQLQIELVASEACFATVPIGTSSAQERRRAKRPHQPGLAAACSLRQPARARPAPRPPMAGRARLIKPSSPARGPWCGEVPRSIRECIGPHSP